MHVAGLKPSQQNRRLITLAALLTLGLSMGILSAAVAYRNPVLSAGLVFVVASSALGIWQPRISFFLFLALLPFVDFLKRLQLAFINPSSLEWYLVLALPDVLLLSAVAGIVLQRLIVQRRLTVRLGNVDWWLLAFAGSMLLSVIHSVFPIEVGMAVLKLGGLYIMVYFLAPVLITKGEHLRVLLKMSFVLSIAVALYGLWQLRFGMSPFEEKWLTGGYTGLSVGTIIYHTFRPFSTLSGPQAYAYYLVIGLICGLIYVRAFAIRTVRIIWYVGMLVGAVALGLSLTRSAVLLFALAWLLGRWMPTVQLRHPTMFFLAAAFLMVSLLLILLRFGGGIQSWALSSGIPFLQRALTVGTLGDRLRGWQGVITDVRYWSLLGYGLGTTSSTVMKKFDLAFNLFSHDEYTNILVEQGVIGLSLFMGFVFSWLRWVTLRLRKMRGPLVNKMCWPFMGFSMAILLTGFLGTNLKVSPINVYFWLMAGLLARSGVFDSMSVSHVRKDA